MVAETVEKKASPRRTERLEQLVRDCPYLLSPQKERLIQDIQPVLQETLPEDLAEQALVRTEHERDDMEKERDAAEQALSTLQDNLRTLLRTVVDRVLIRLTDSGIDRLGPLEHWETERVIDEVKNEIQ